MLKFIHKHVTRDDEKQPLIVFFNNYVKEKIMSVNKRKVFNEDCTLSYLTSSKCP